MFSIWLVFFFASSFSSFFLSNRNTHLTKIQNLMNSKNKIFYKPFKANFTNIHASRVPIHFRKEGLGNYIRKHLSASHSTQYTKNELLNGSICQYCYFCWWCYLFFGWNHKDLHTKNRVRDYNDRIIK